MRVLAMFAAVTALWAVPFAAVAASQSITTVYHTAYRQIQPVETAGEVTGVLRLRIAPDGIVSGAYRDEFGSHLYNVAGGTKGGRIWFSFTTPAFEHFFGTIEKDGTIKGTLTISSAPRTYRLTAVPAKS